MAKIRFGNRSIDLPERRWLRIAIGGGLVAAGGLGGWLPVLGFWMVPLGLLILSADVPAVRRLNRKVTVKAVSWWRGRQAARDRNSNGKAGSSGRDPLRDSSLSP